MSFLSKIFGNEETVFNEIRVDVEVLNSVIYYSTQAFPNEFLALFDGKIKDEVLYITSLVFLPGETCNTGAVFHSDMVPQSLKYWGTVHCHPGPSALPSDADLFTFSKHGVFHMIVCLPYSLETFKAYDKHGDPVNYTVGDYSHLIDVDDSDFFDEDDVLKEGESIEPGLFDEKDDDFFKSDEENKVVKPTNKIKSNSVVINLTWNNEK